MSYDPSELRADIIELFDEAARTGRYLTLPKSTRTKRVRGERTFVEILDEAADSSAARQAEGWKKRVATWVRNGRVCPRCGAWAPDHRCPDAEHAAVVEHVTAAE